MILCKQAPLSSHNLTITMDIVSWKLTMEGTMGRIDTNKHRHTGKLSVDSETPQKADID
jgi:hypothetical protein